MNKNILMSLSIAALAASLGSATVRAQLPLPPDKQSLVSC
jgi:hypothetical protein